MFFFFIPQFFSPKKLSLPPPPYQMMHHTPWLQANHHLGLFSNHHFLWWYNYNWANFLMNFRRKIFFENWPLMPLISEFNGLPTVSWHLHLVCVPFKFHIKGVLFVHCIIYQQSEHKCSNIAKTFSERNHHHVSCQIITLVKYDDQQKRSISGIFNGHPIFNRYVLMTITNFEFSDNFLWLKSWSFMMLREQPLV